MSCKERDPIPLADVSMPPVQIGLEVLTEADPLVETLSRVGTSYHSP